MCLEPLNFELTHMPSACCTCSLSKQQKKDALTHLTASTTGLQKAQGAVKSSTLTWSELYFKLISNTKQSGPCPKVQEYSGDKPSCKGKYKLYVCVCVFFFDQLSPL